MLPQNRNRRINQFTCYFILFTVGFLILIIILPFYRPNWHTPQNEPSDRDYFFQYQTGDSNKYMIYRPEMDLFERFKYQYEQVQHEFRSLQLNKSSTEMIPQDGGTPEINLLITMWRSGSTFIGNILNAMPTDFYHYEPLISFGVKQLRDPKELDSGIELLQHLMHCNYTNMPDYMKFLKTSEQLRFNSRIWVHCDYKPLSRHERCFVPDIMRTFCRMYPYHSMKILRLRLPHVEPLMVNNDVKVRLLYVVRDPRGTIQSRKKSPWCHKAPDCSDPKIICSDMVEDYKAAIVWNKRYHETFMAIRYEDFSKDVIENTKKIFKFYNRPYHNNVDVYVRTHMKALDGKGFDFYTYRNSSYAPIEWIDKMPFSEVSEIQNQCKEALELFGYPILSEADFNEYRDNMGKRIKFYENIKFTLTED